MFLDDTIAAIATPLGFGGIGVVRVSGPESFRIAQSLTRKPQMLPNYSYHTWLKDNLDEVLITFFRSPKSYTGEDSLEVSCHGNPHILDKVLSLTFNLGARQAQNGEFTKRAFLNGKMDLVQAESVQNIVNAKSSELAKLSAFQLRGGLSFEVNQILEECMSAYSLVQGEIDFPDDIHASDMLSAKIESIVEKLKIILSTAEYGKLIRCGISAVIVGKPNVGKSSLLNALLNTNRAIVTDFPGTTRDTIIEPININGLIVNLIDTAGIRTPENLPEKLSIDQTKESIDTSTLMLVVLDGSKQLDDDDREILDIASSKPHLVIINKSDLGVSIDIKGIQASAINSLGLDELKSAIYNRYFASGVNPDMVLTSQRQVDCLEAAKCSLQRIIERDNIALSLELVSIDLQEAILSLGNMLGNNLGDDVINKIFADFCVGK